MRAFQIARKFLKQPADQNGIAVADLSGFRRLIWRNNFIAGREMHHAQTRANERLRATRRRQQRQFTRVQTLAR